MTVKTRHIGSIFFSYPAQILASMSPTSSIMIFGCHSNPLLVQDQGERTCRGLRDNYKPARESVAKDTARGWIRPGRRDLVTVPARLVPKNVVPRRQWKLVQKQLVSVTKWRVTTDWDIERRSTSSRSISGSTYRWHSGIQSHNTTEQIS